MEPEVDSYSRCVSFLDHRRAVVFSSTLSQDVISSHFSLKERNHHGRPVLCVMRHVFNWLSQYPPISDVYYLMTLEKFVVMMYNRTTQVGVLRMQGWMTLCLLGNRLYEDIPPCQTATHQHMKCTTYRSGRTWSLSTICQTPNKVLCRLGIDHD